MCTHIHIHIFNVYKCVEYGRLENTSLNILKHEKTF